MLTALVATALLTSFVHVDTGGVDADRATRDALERDVVEVLLNAGHALVPDPLRADQVLRLSGPTAEGTWLVLADGEAPWSTEVSQPLTDDAQRALLARVGPPPKRSGDRIAVSLAIAAYEPTLEQTLQRELPLKLLRDGLPVTRRRQPVDVRVCVAVQPDAVRLSAANVGKTCGDVLGRLPQPGRFDAATLTKVLGDAAFRLGNDALAHAQMNRELPDAEPDDQGTLAELLAKDADARQPARLGNLQPSRLNWGWHLLVPESFALTGSLGLLTRPSDLDPSLQGEARALFPLGITAGVFVRGVPSGPIASPVLETEALLGVGYEHRAGYGFTLRAGLYGGGRMHLWSGPEGGYALDPVVGVIVGGRYAILPTLDLDVSLPLTGTNARSHLLDDGSVWGRRELGVGLNVGLTWAFDAPW